MEKADSRRKCHRTDSERNIIYHMKNRNERGETMRILPRFRELAFNQEEIQKKCIRHSTLNAKGKWTVRKAFNSAAEL